MIKTMKWLAASVLLGLGVTAHAAVVLQVSGGKLTGATGVQVGASTYDVTFMDGTCASVFNDCDDSTSDFTFTTKADALAAGNALESSVLVDGTLGNFDSVPESIFGCSATGSQCDVITPWGLDSFDPDYVQEVTIQNFGGSGTDTVNAGKTALIYDTSNANTAVWAVWTPAAAVPEPGSLALLGLGLAGLAVSRRRRQ